MGLVLQDSDGIVTIVLKAVQQTIRESEKEYEIIKNTSDKQWKIHIYWPD